MNSRARPRSRGWLGTTLAALLAVTIGGRANAGRPVVAVAPFHGPDSGTLEQVVQRVLQSRAVIVSSTRYSQVAKSLFAEGSSPEDVAAVARELGASFVITGATKLEAGRWTLLVTLREGKAGRTMAKLRYPLTSPRSPPAVVRLMQSELIGALRDALVAPSPMPIRSRGAKEAPASWDEPRQPEEPPPAEVRKQQARDEDWPPRDANSPPRTQPAEAPRDAPAPVRPTTATTPTTPTATPAFSTYKSGRAKWAHWFELGVGVGISSRTFATDPAPPRFSNGVAAGVHVEATLFPFAFSWDRAWGVFSGLGIGIDLDLPFWPPAAAKADPTQQLQISEIRVEGGLRWKLTLYKPLPRPQLTLLVEGGLHSFLFARAADGTQLSAVPDTRYVYATIGGRLTVHFADWAWIWAQFQYHVVTDSGPIQLQANYGLAVTVGFRFSAGLDFLVWRGLRMGVQGNYERFTSRYGYDMNRAQIRDTSMDEYFGGTALIGYVF